MAFVERLDPVTGWVDLIETYEIDGDLEIPRIDLGIYGDHGSYGLPSDERRRLAAERLSLLLGQVAHEPVAFIFQVWLDCEEEPKNER